MAKTSSLYIASLEPSTGSLFIAIGLMDILKSRYEKVAFFRPIIKDRQNNDSDIIFMREHFSLTQPYEECYCFDREEAEAFLADDQPGKLITQIITHYKKLEKLYDFVLIEGLPRSLFSATLDFDINLLLSKNLSTPFIPILNAQGKSCPSIYDEMKIEAEIISDEGVSHFATFVNRVDETQLSPIQEIISQNPLEEMRFFLPENSELDTPTMEEVTTALDAKMILGDIKTLDNVVKQSKIAAMTLENYLPRIQEGSLIIAPADRMDIIIATFVSFYAKGSPNVAGMILSGDLLPNEMMMQLLKDFHVIEFPIFSVSTDTYTTAQHVNSVRSRITPKSKRKIALAKGIFETHVDRDLIIKELQETPTSIMTPMMFTYTLFERARKKKQRIVLPESSDDRILRAAEILMRRDVAEIILLGDKEEIAYHASLLSVDISEANIIDPSHSILMDAFSEHFFELRKHKGLSLDAAKDAMVHPNYFATMMVHLGMADGMVSGAIHTTADTIRPALQIIKTAQKDMIVSSLFFMCLQTRVLVYGDCAVNQDPTDIELAQIAISSAETAQNFGIEPRVAMLSYSTGSSGQGNAVDKVRQATKIAQELRPELLIEGPIQYDAAIDPDVAKTKLPESKVAGEATVFIFPDLNTGNNTYKAVQRSSGAIAIGPVLQGLKKPVNDLSRGCSVEDIINTVAITAIQAQGIS